MLCPPCVKSEPLREGSIPALAASLVSPPGVLPKPCLVSSQRRRPLYAHLIPNNLVFGFWVPSFDAASEFSR